MDQPRTKADLLAAMEAGRQEWAALLANIDPGRMTTPDVQGDWSIKDIVAHVAWYEREIAGVLQARALVGSDLWDHPTHERNATLRATHRDDPLAAVLADEQAAYQLLAAHVAALEDVDLTDARRFRDMPADWQPWTLVAENSYLHYPEHIRAVRAWLSQHAVQ